MRVHREIEGDGRPALVFTHGIGVDLHTFDALTGELADRHRIVRWDLLGHGGSEVPDDPSEYSRDRALDDLDEVVADLDELVLVGHSLGGYLSLAWALTRPGRARGLVVLATGPGFRDPEKRQAWNDRSRRNAHRFGVPPQAAELNLQEDGFVIERLGELDIPVLVLVGDADRPELIGGSQYLTAKLPMATLVTVPGGEHAMHEESHAADVADAIEAFLAQVDSQP